MLVKPGLESTGRPNLSTLVSQLSSSLVDFWMAVESFRDASESFPKLFTGWSLMEGMIVRCNELLSLFPADGSWMLLPRHFWDYCDNFRLRVTTLSLKLSQ